MPPSPRIEVQLLGPVRICADGQPVALGGPATRAVLAMLALERGRSVPRDRLVDELWGDEPPRRARESLQMHVSRIRKGLTAAGVPAERLSALGAGYRLELAAGECDLDHWEQARREAARAAAAGDLADERRLLAEGLARWRGTALDGVAANGRLSAARARMEQERLEATLARIAADVDLEAHAGVLGELEALAAEHPYQETVTAHRMRALYRAGRQADALEVYAEARRRLVDDLGLEPGPELRALQAAVLRQDADLLPAPGSLPAELATDVPLCGREPELAWLEEHWRAARRGAAAVVLITGSPGIGKSRLAAEIAARAHATGGVVRHARGEHVAVALDELSAGRRPALLVAEDPPSGLPDPPPGSLIVAVAEEAPELERHLAARDAHRRLGSLDEAALARLAAAYGPHPPPADELLRASGGVPARAHRAAWGWARAAAVQRVAAAAHEARAQRGELEAAREVLEGDIADLERIRRTLHRGGGPPFKGLLPFGAGDAGVFFGRERLVAKLVARLVGAPALALAGPSGSGKSSLLHAGLLPALAAGALPDAAARPQVAFRPGRRPLVALERALGEAPDRLGETPVIVAVDQFEEVFGDTVDAAEREAFLDALVALAGRAAIVFLTIRADVLARCADHPAFAALLDDRTVLVGRMRPGELRSAIELPARAAGAEVERPLTDALVGDLGDAPGGLPLLSSALLELWENRDGRVLRLADYERLGGVRGAIGRLAEAAYQRLAPAEQDAARRLLVRLAATESGAVARRRIALDELDLTAGGALETALETLRDGRLLTVDEGAVEVAHEALFAHWPRLAGWLADDAQGRRLLAHLERAAGEWEEDRDPASLYRGARLVAALEWAGQHGEALTGRERRFLDASRAHAEHETTVTRRANRRLRALLAAAAVAFVAAAIGGIVAVQQRGEAEDEARVALAQRLGAQALVEPQLDRSLLMAVAATRTDDSVATRGSLLAAVLRSPAAIGEMHGDGGRLLSLALSPDGRTLAAGDNHGTVLFFDTATRQPTGPAVTAAGSVHGLAWTPDGRVLVAAGGGPDGGFVQLLDRERVRDTLVLDPDITFGGVGFQDSGQTLVAVGIRYSAGATEIARFGLDGTRRPGASVRLPLFQPPRLSVAPGSGNLLLSGIEGDDVAIVHRTGTRELRRLDGAGWNAALAPSGATVVGTDEDEAIVATDVRTGEIRRLDGRHPAWVQSMGFTPDSRTMISTGDEGDVYVWDLPAGRILERLEGHSGRIPAQAVSSDGATLYTAALDGSIIVWDLRGDRRLGYLHRVRPDRPDYDPQPEGALSPDGRTLAAVRPHGVSLVDTEAQRLRAVLRVDDARRVIDVTFSPDGATIVVAGERGLVRRFDARTLEPRGVPLAHHRADTWAPTFAPDGSLMATGSADGAIRLLEPDGEMVATARVPTPAYALAFSSDGRWLVAASDQRPASVYSVPSLEPVTTLESPGGMATEVAFSPDGDLLAVGDADGTTQLWRVDDWRPLGRALNAHAGLVTGVAFSRDGRLLATGATDGTIRLADVASGTELGTPLPGDPNRWVSVHVGPGDRIHGVYASGRVAHWRGRVAEWQQHACAVAGRDLTAWEWQRLDTNRPFAPVCPR